LIFLGRGESVTGNAPYSRFLSVARREYNGRMDTSLESIAREFVKAINRQDLETLATLMPEEHRFIDSLGRVMVGRENVRAGWVEYFRMVADYSIELQETFIRGPVVVMLGLAQGSFAKDGQLTELERWSSPAVFRAFIDDDKVKEWRVYADNEPVRKRIRKNK
jgi:ketosteroid isomerase-like protein